MDHERLGDMEPPFEPARPEDFIAQSEIAFLRWWEELEPPGTREGIELDHTTARIIWQTAYEHQFQSQDMGMALPSFGAILFSVRSYDLATGDLLWYYGGHTASAIPMPAIGHGLVFTASGWRQDLLQAVRLGEGGDLSENVVWKINRGVPYVPSPMLWGDELFVLDDRNLFSAFNATDGTEHFKNRLPGIVNFSTSPVGASDRIYLVDEQGATIVVQRGIQFKVLAVNRLPDAFYASPALVGDAIFLRGQEHLYCFQHRAD